MSGRAPSPLPPRGGWAPLPTKRGLGAFLMSVPSPPTKRGLGALLMPVPSELNMSSALPALWKHMTRNLLRGGGGRGLRECMGTGSHRDSLLPHRNVTVGAPPWSYSVGAQLPTSWEPPL